MKWAFYILLGVFVLSCKKKEPEPLPNLGYDYYPITLGKYVIYDVDSTVYDEITFQPTTYKYRIKEKLEEQFTDPENKQAIRLVRYIKKYDSTKTYDQIPWAVKDAWQVNLSQSSLEVVEENIRFTKLIFAVKESAKWDGNAKNTIGEWLYTYSYVDHDETINNMPLEKVLLVTQKDYRTLISYQYYVEKYVRGIGLVYREIKDIYSNNVVPGVPVEGRIEKGTIYTSKIVSYGNE